MKERRVSPLGCRPEPSFLSMALSSGGSVFAPRGGASYTDFSRRPLATSQVQEGPPTGLCRSGGPTRTDYFPRIESGARSSDFFLLLRSRLAFLAGGLAVSA